MIIHNIEQGSDEWLAVRLGKFTASDFHILMGNSATKKTILLKKAAERLTGKAADSDSFSNIHTERGKEKEAAARNLYSVIKLADVKEVGFIEGEHNVGCSPDGLIGEEGGVEIKCKDNHTHLYAAINNYVEPTHKTQCQFSMMVTNRKWWDYCLYNENYNKPVIIRLERDEDHINNIRSSLQECENIVEKHISRFLSL